MVKNGQKTHYTITITNTMAFCFVLSQIQREHPETRAALQRPGDRVEDKLFGSTGDCKSILSGSRKVYFEDDDD